MKTEILLLFLLIQFIVQLVMYIPFYKICRRVLFFFFSAYKYINYWLKKLELDMVLPKILLFPKVYVSFFAVYLFCLNICVSIFVKLFTSEGAMTGMTNLFASVFIGLISVCQAYAFKKKWNIEYSKLK